MEQTLRSQERGFGKVVLIGGGPGDVLLITIKGKEYIRKADCIIYDRLASKDILNYAKKSCECIFVGKENHHHVMKQQDINKLLVKKSYEYNLVVRLKGGDPYVFGRGSEEALYLAKRGIRVDVLPGVTSIVSALESAGIPVTHRGLAKGFMVLSAHSRQDKMPDIDYKQLLDNSITLVFVMGLMHVGEISKGLLKAGRRADTPVAVVSKGTTVYQRKCVASLIDIADKVKSANLKSPALIVVGDVVSLSDELDFFEKRPLYGKRINVPYIESFRFSYEYGRLPFNENALITMLREHGAIVDSIKVGKINPIIVDDMDKYLSDAWLIFTSNNGVNAFMYSLFHNSLDARALSGCKIAAIGKKTANCLKGFGLICDFIPKRSTAYDLAIELSDRLSPNDKVIYLSAKEAELDIGDILGKDISYDRLVVYENEAIDTYDNEKMLNEKEAIVDYTCYTSASNVNRFIRTYKGNKGKAVSIGEGCSKALINEGVTEYIQAEEPSYEQMVKAIIKAG